MKRHAIIKKWVRPVTIVLLVGWGTLGTAAAAASAIDHSPYAGLLKRNVADGVMDDKGFRTAEATLDRYLAVLAAVNPDTLSAPDRFAFCANADNAWTIGLILTHYPGIDSIKQI